MLKKVVKSILKTAFSAAAPLCSRISTLEPEAARACLQGVSPCPGGSALACNRVTEPVCDLQIIIPAYNVEAYLEECLESVLNQKTKYRFHVLLVDDGSTDGTAAIADRYAQNPCLTVIHQENRGFSGARNRALEEIFARYVMFVDSDDQLCPGAVEHLLAAAEETGCPIAEGGAYYLTGQEQSCMYAYSAQEPVPAWQFHGQPWGKVYRAELFENLKFPEGFWYEDSILSFFLWDQAGSGCTVPEMVYIHRRNPQGITAASRGRAKAVDTWWITQTLHRERTQLGLYPDGSYFARLLDQIRLNHYRVRELPLPVQEAVFVLSCQLLEQTFAEAFPENRDTKLVQALKRRDFGAFRMLCRLY